MKSYKSLYPQIYPFANLYQAFRTARKGGKRKKVEVASFEFDLEHNRTTTSGFGAWVRPRQDCSPKARCSGFTDPVLVPRESTPDLFPVGLPGSVQPKIPNSHSGQ